MLLSPKIRKSLKLAALATIVLSSAITPAVAQNSDIRTGAITSVWVSSAENFGFRVYLNNNGVDTLANCTGGFAYVNASTSNYNVYVATLLSDYHRGRAVSLTVLRDANQFCLIAEASG